MKMNRTLVSGLTLLLLLAGGTAAQEKAKAVAVEKQRTPVKIQVVFSEFDGEKKVSSMPYTFSTLATEDPDRLYGRVRMGLKVPVMSGQKDSTGLGPIQYMDVGTSIDAQLTTLSDGRYSLDLGIRRSSVYTLEGANKEIAWSMGEGSGRPILREFSSQLTFVLRDNQTQQSAMATDPVSGHVLKVDVALNVIK